MRFGYKRLYIDGDLTDSYSNEKRQIVCPGNEEVVAEIAWAGSEDAQRALVSAQKGFASWSKLSLAERTKWMLKLRTAVIEREQELREAVVYEMGKTWAQSLEDFETVINALEFYPHAMQSLDDVIIPDPENTHHHHIVHQPAGVVVAYLAWNFPLLNFGFKIGPALAAGCSIIIKPSTASPVSAYIMGEILNSIKFPGGVVNILAGSNDEVAEVLSTSHIPAVITMIGSTETGKKVIAKSNASSIKRMSMELGGNAPFIVFEDADINKAVADLTALKYGNCGQVCVSPNRIFIHELVYEEFMKIFLKKVNDIKIGFGIGSDVDMGPIINSASLDYLESLVNNAVKQGGKLLTGGRRSKKFIKGFFFEPTVIENIHPDMEIFKTEVFGPVAGIMSFSKDDEVLELANKTDAGLASYIYTADINRVNRFTSSLEFGEVQVNGFKYAIYLPHGGIKQSGMGHDCSYLALYDYLVKKRISITIK